MLHFSHVAGSHAHFSCSSIKCLERGNFFYPTCKILRALVRNANTSLFLLVMQNDYSFIQSRYRGSVHHRFAAPFCDLLLGPAVAAAPIFDEVLAGATSKSSQPSSPVACSVFFATGGFFVDGSSSKSNTGSPLASS